MEGLETVGKIARKFNITEKPYENNVVFFLLRFCNEHSKMAKDEAIKTYKSEILFRKNINELIKR